MMSIEIPSGKTLSAILKKLGVEVGAVSQNTIDAWFDTDCNVTKQFLNWMCNSLDQENVLLATELEEYSELRENNAILFGKEYDDILVELNENYPGLLDYETNCLEVDFLTDELEMLSDYEEALNKNLNINKKIGNKLKIEQCKTKDEESHQIIEMETAESKCLELTEKLSENHQKLALQIFKYSKHLNNFEMDLPTFLFSLSTETDDKYCLDTLLHVETALSNETGISFSNQRMETTFCNGMQNDVLDLQERIFQSAISYMKMRLLEESLKEKLKYLSETNIRQLMLQPFNENLPLYLDGKMQQMQLFMNEFENASHMDTDQLVETKLTLARNNLTRSRQKFDNLKALNNKLTENLSRYSLTMYLLNQEQKDIEGTDNYFHGVYEYILTKLLYSSSRINTMSKYINEYNEYQDSPVENQIQLLQIISKALSGKSNTTLTEIINVANAVRNEERNLDNQLFCKDFVEYERQCKQIKENSEMISKFLSNGATKDLLVFPPGIISTLEEVKNLMDHAVSNEVKSRQMYKETKQKLEKKLFRMQRQLWMLFLTDPDKMVGAIQQIKHEIKLLRNSKCTDDKKESN